MVWSLGKLLWAIALGVGVWVPGERALGDQPSLPGGIVQSMHLLGDHGGDRHCELQVMGDRGQPLTLVTDAKICQRNIVGYGVKMLPDDGTQGTVRPIEVLEPPQTGVIESMVIGDRACYVTVVDHRGESSTEFANFDLCEQDFEGQELQFSYRLISIVSSTCNGDLDCGKRDWVMAIDRVTVEIPGLQQPILPKFTQAEMNNLNVALAQGKDTWFGLAGLGKTPPPPVFPNALSQYRQTWQQQNPAITPFLGQWQNDETYPYTLTIFPSTEPGKVCLLEFRPEWSLDILNEVTGKINKDIIAPQLLSFSTAKIEGGILRSSQIRTTDQAIASHTFSSNQAETVELMGVARGTDYTLTLAAAALPMFPPELPEILVQSITPLLQANRCVGAKEP